MRPSATAEQEIRPAKGTMRELSLHLWPEADRNAWYAACRPAARLKPGGAVGHLRPDSRETLARHYGCFLDFLRRRGLLKSNEQAAVQVTPQNVEAYIAELNDHVSSVTVYAAICTLRRAAKYMSPGRDLTWLAEIAKDLKLVARPRSKFDRMVTTEVLVEAGLTLITEAEISSTLTDLGRAHQFRNGLMMAMLALCPIRPKNFAALEIGRSFVKIN
jgi:hypothetical protein